MRENLDTNCLKHVLFEIEGSRIIIYPILPRKKAYKMLRELSNMIDESISNAFLNSR